MNNKGKQAIGFLFFGLPLILILAVIASCNFAGKTATIIIPIGETSGKAAGVPGTPPLLNQVASIMMRVEGADLDPVEKTFYPDTDSGVFYAAMEAPSGYDRTVTLMVNLTKDLVKNPTALLQIAGKTVADLPQGETVYLKLDMYASETRLIVPDTSNFRLLQFDDMSQIVPAATQQPQTTIDGLSSFSLNPYDVDFDRWGRIYIVNNVGSSPKLWRLDSFTDTATPQVSVGIGGSGFVAVAVDSMNSYVYFATGLSQIYRCSLDGLNQVPINIPGSIITSITGMDVDDEGYLYVSGNVNILPTAAPGIVKLKPDAISSTFMGGMSRETNPLISDPLDILVKDGNVYVANHSGTPGYQIIVLDKNLTKIIGHFGTKAVSIDPAKGAFYSPIRFVAVLNRKITVIDEAGTLDKLVAFDDSSGSNWDVLPDDGDGYSSGLFQFYYGC